MQAESFAARERGVLRGLHYQQAPHAQSKLIRVLSRRNLRRRRRHTARLTHSGRWVGVTLSAENRRMVYVPHWCAHGFCVTSDNAEVVYMTTTEYAPAHESGFMWNDPRIDIAWPHVIAHVVRTRHEVAAVRPRARGSLDPGPRDRRRRLRRQPSRGSPHRARTSRCRLAAAGTWIWSTALRWRGPLADVRPATVFHCAGSAHVGQSWTDARETLATNVLGTHHLLDGLRKAGVVARACSFPARLSSTGQSDGALSEDDPIGPATPYAVSKLAQEMLGRASIAEDGQQVFLTRSFNHTGPRQDPSFAAPAFASQIALIEKGGIAPVIAVGNLDATRDLTDVRDTVRAYRDIVERGRPGIRLQRLLRQGAQDWRRARPLGRAEPRAGQDPGGSGPLPAERQPCPLGNPGRIERDTGWKPRFRSIRPFQDLLDYWRKEVE